MEAKKRSLNSLKSVLTTEFSNIVFERRKRETIIMPWKEACTGNISIAKKL